MDFLHNHLRVYDSVIPGHGSWEYERIKEVVRTMADRTEEDRQEASKLMVDASKVAITLGSGAIALNGAFLQDQKAGDLEFWCFLFSMLLFVISILAALTVTTRTIQRAGGERGALAWDYAQEKHLLDTTAVFGFLGLAAFIVGAVLN